MCMLLKQNEASVDCALVFVHCGREWCGRSIGNKWIQINIKQGVKERGEKTESEWCTAGEEWAWWVRGPMCYQQHSDELHTWGKTTHFYGPNLSTVRSLMGKMVGWARSRENRGMGPAALWRLGMDWYEICRYNKLSQKYSDFTALQLYHKNLVFWNVCLKNKQLSFYWTQSILLVNTIENIQNI